MNNETLDHGTIAENIIDNLCQVKFFKDFVARSPKYNKSNGNKEISDVLVVFNDVILNFQVKSKLENKNFYQKEKKDIERIESKITKAVEQLKELTSVLRNKIVCDIKNSRGIKIPLPDGAKKIGIICLNLAGEEKFPTSEQTGLRMLFDEKYDHEIHFFKIEVLNLILSELTTLPDFLHYLEFRRQYIANGLLTPTIPEYDFLAFYKTQYATALKFLDDKKAGKNVMVYLEPGLWENYLQNEDVIVQRNMANEISGWYDDIIDTKYLAIDFSIDNTIPAADENDYWKTVSCLARLNRIQRRELSNVCVRKAFKMVYANHDYGYSMITFPDLQISFVYVACKNVSRRERINILSNLCCAAAAYSKDLTCIVKDIVGIATEEANPHGASNDVLIATVDDLLAACPENDPLKVNCKKIFGITYDMTTTEFHRSKNNVF